MAVMINDAGLAEAWKLIESELRQNDHRPYPRDIVRRAALLQEERGEVLGAALDMSRDTVFNTTGMTDAQVADHGRRLLVKYQSRVLVEAIHSAAMAIRLIVALMQEMNDQRQGGILS